MDSNQYEVEIALSGTLDVEGQSKDQAGAKACKKLQRALEVSDMDKFIESEGFDMELGEITEQDCDSV